MALYNNALLLSLCCLAPLAASANDALTVYGKLNLSLQANKVQGESETLVKSNSSRLGVKGQMAVNDQLTAFYTVEYEVDTDSAVKENFKARNQFVGLKGDFGALTLGRNDTMLKKSQGKVDLFSDLDGDLKQLFKGDNRMTQTVSYQTPKLGGLSLGLTYIAKGDSGQSYETQVGEILTEKSTDGVSIGARYGDAKLKSSSLYAALAYDAKVKGYDILRASLQGRIADITLGGMFQQQEKIDSGLQRRGYLLSAAYPLFAVKLKTQYQHMDDKGSSWSVGADYQAAKATKLYTFYTQRDPDGLSKLDRFLGIGLSQRF